MNAPRIRPIRSRLYLLALLLIAVPAWWLYQSSGFENAAQPIRALGGKVYEDREGSGKFLGSAGITFIDLSGTKVSDEDLRDLGDQLAGLRGLRILNLSRTSISDAGLLYLKGLTQLQSLDLSETRITEEGATRLSKALPHAMILTKARPALPVGR